MHTGSPSTAAKRNRRLLHSFSTAVLALAGLVLVPGATSCSSKAEGGSCASAGGTCVLGNVSCAQRASSDSQDCNPSPPNPGGAFCCLDLAQGDAAGSGGASGGPGVAPDASSPDAPSATTGPAAVCADPTHGNVDAYTDCPGLTALLVGRWFSCDYGKGPDLYMSHQGIEFNADGTWNILQIAPGGQVTPLTGVLNQGTWAPQQGCTPPNSWVSVVDAAGTTPTRFAFEDNPRRMLGLVGTEGAEPWFVPLP